MYLHVWFLFCNLWLVYSDDVIFGSDDSSSIFGNCDDTCGEYYLHLINHYFHQTTIKPTDTTKIQYCENHRSHPFIDLSQVIELYSLLTDVKSYTNTNSNDPVIKYGILHINENKLPIYQVADIRRHHIRPCSSHPDFGSDVDRQMLLMGKLNTDECGQLLAHSLGGSSEASNIIPISRNVKGKPACVDDNVELGLPSSNWKSNEDWIRRFLYKAYPNGRVAWRVALQYRDDFGFFDTYRPKSFTLQYTAYTNQDDDNSVYYISPQVTFLNHDNQYCRFSEAESKCYVRHPIEPKGIMGEETSHGSWNTRHQVCFPYTIGGKHYFYCQSILDGRHWFIQELLPNGQMGEETDHGSWKIKYAVVFPFFINGRQFFYGHSIEQKNWFIQELLPGGKMGQETSHGFWNTRHQVSFPYTIGGKHYFYGQSILDGRHWFIQELLPNGQMGQEISHGHWKQNYPLAFPFMINGRQFFYGHSIENKYWFIQELLPGGRMGEETSNGFWNTRHQVSFPFSIGGKTYFYGQSILDGRHWFIQELLPNGQMGKELSHGSWNQKYPVAFPFSINGRQFFYGHSTEVRNWFIQELL